MEQILKSFTLDFFGKGKHKISPAIFFERDDTVFLDIRAVEETKCLAIELTLHDWVKYINIPTNEIPDRLDEIPRDKFIGIFCPTNIRSGFVYPFLLSKGFSDVRIIMGGYAALTDEMLPGKVLQLTLQD